MAFTATFYNITDNPKKIDKTFGTEQVPALKTAVCTPFEPVSDLHGSILVDYDNAIDNANYATVTTGGRTLCCFVRDVIKDIGGRCRVELDIDPLTTNAEQLKECDCICETTCNTGQTYSNRYITNPNLKVTQFTIHGNVKKDTETLLGMDQLRYVVGIYSDGLSGGFVGGE